MKFPNFQIENEYSSSNIVGIDEVGRGPLAGPLVVCALKLDQNSVPEGINDSKLVTPTKRKLIYAQLCEVAKFGIGIASVQEIDELKLTKATKLAIDRALENLDISIDIALIDGKMNYELVIKTVPVVSGDKKSLSIAASSIVAKVIRDNYMIELSQIYPKYLWHKNVGYGTSAHLAAIKKFGITIHHRLSFAPIKNNILS